MLPNFSLVVLWPTWLMARTVTNPPCLELSKDEKFIVIMVQGFRCTYRTGQVR
jgi:hypothetical protein